MPVTKFSLTARGEAVFISRLEMIIPRLEMVIPSLEMEISFLYNKIILPQKDVYKRTIEV